MPCFSLTTFEILTLTAIALPARINAEFSTARPGLRRPACLSRQHLLLDGCASQQLGLEPRLLTRDLERAGTANPSYGILAQAATVWIGRLSSCTSAQGTKPGSTSSLRLPWIEARISRCQPCSRSLQKAVRRCHLKALTQLQS